MHSGEGRTMAGRAELALIGALAGLSIWVLMEKAQDVAIAPHLFLGASAAVAGFFAVLLALSGPAQVMRAIPSAGLLSLVAAALVAWAGMRFETLEAFFQAGHPVYAWAIFLFIGTPFAAVIIQDHASFRDYARLFEASWSIVVRYSASWLFVAVVWAVLILSNALLEIVGVTVIEDLLDIDAVPQVFTGMALGLGLSVVHELRAVLSPFLVLRLLRMLVPVMVVVVVVFIAALLLQDRQDWFGGLSPAATLLAVALGCVSLVSIALDKEDADAVKTGWMRWATAALALMLPVLAALAAYAIWLRVAEFGWTPSRLTAASVAAVVSLYSAAYAGSVILRGRWLARIRQANIRIAALIFVGCAIWLTPLFNAEAVSTSSQLARYLDNQVDVDESAVWEMAHQWGKPGREGLAILHDLEGDEHAAIREASLLAAANSDRYAFETRKTIAPDQSRGAGLLALVQVLPEDVTLSSDVLARVPEFRLNDWTARCAERSDPGCILVIADFDPNHPEQEGVFFLPGRAGRYDAVAVVSREGQLFFGAYLTVANGAALTVEDMRAMLVGEYRIAPSSKKSLWIENKELFPSK